MNVNVSIIAGFTRMSSPRRVAIREGAVEVEDEVALEVMVEEEAEVAAAVVATNNLLSTLPQTEQLEEEST